MTSTTLNTVPIYQALGPLAPIFDITCVQQCESTNLLLNGITLPQPERITVVLTEEQLAGRGRRGKRWCSFGAGSLLFSSRWPLADNIAQAACLSLVSAIAVARAIEALGVVAVGLKWPNDVLIAGDKVCGILTELSRRPSSPTGLIIGIGINIALPSAVELPDQRTDITAIAAHLPTAKVPDRNILAAAVLRNMHTLFDMLTRDGFAAVKSHWDQRDVLVQRHIVVSNDTQQMTGRYLGIDDDGALRLETEAGAIHRLLAGDVSLRPLQQDKC